MRRHAALSHRLPPAPIPAPIPAPPAAPAIEEPPGPPRAPVIPVPPVHPLKGAAAARTDRSPRPKVRCGPGQRPCTGSSPRITSSPARVPAAPRAYLGSSGGAGAAGGARPVPRRGGEPDTPPPRERSGRTSPAPPALGTRVAGVPAGPGYTGAVGSAWSHGAATDGDIPAHLKYPSPALPRSFALHFRSGFTSLLPSRRQRSAPPSASSCLEPFFSPENSFPPHHAIWQCQHLSVPFSITCHKSDLHFQWMTFEITPGIEEGSPPPPPPARQFV